jgi:hypothetical protein
MNVPKLFGQNSDKKCARLACGYGGIRLQLFCPLPQAAGMDRREQMGTGPGAHLHQLTGGWRAAVCLSSAAEPPARAVSRANADSRGWRPRKVRPEAANSRGSVCRTDFARLAARRDKKLWLTLRSHTVKFGVQLKKRSEMGLRFLPMLGQLQRWHRSAGGVAGGWNLRRVLPKARFHRDGSERN